MLEPGPVDGWFYHDDDWARAALDISTDDPNPLSATGPKIILRGVRIEQLRLDPEELRLLRRLCHRPQDHRRQSPLLAAEAAPHGQPPHQMLPELRRPPPSIQPRLPLRPGRQGAPHEPANLPPLGLGLAPRPTIPIDTDIAMTAPKETSAPKRDRPTPEFPSPPSRQLLNDY